MEGKHREWMDKFVGENALLLFFIALGISGSIEFFQAWPEFFPAGHEIGEVARNLGYGIAGAFAFNWIMVEVPRRREARRILDAHWNSLSNLANAGGRLLAEYRMRVPGVHDAETDTQTKEGMKDFLSKIRLIASLESPSVRVRDAKTGEAFIESDPFAYTSALQKVEETGHVIAPYIHRLEPKVHDAIMELIQFPQAISRGHRVISRPPGMLDQEIDRIWDFVSASRQVRIALKKHYPQRKIVKVGYVFGGFHVKKQPILEEDM